MLQEKAVMSIEDQIESLRSKRELLEVDSASYSSSTLSRWKDRLLDAKRRQEEARLRNQKLVEDTRSFSTDYHDSVRVAQVSQKAFGYEVAVKEYLRKVKKLLPLWLEKIQPDNVGKIQRQTGEAPQKSPSSRKIQDQGYDTSPLKTVKRGNEKLAKTPKKSNLHLEVSLEGEKSTSESFKFKGSGEEEKDQSFNSSPALSPASTPVQTATFTTMLVRSEGSLKAKKPDSPQSTRSRNSTGNDQESRQPTPSAERSLSGRDPPTHSKTFQSEEPSTATRVRFLGEDIDLELDLEEDSQDTFDSYAEPGYGSPLAQKNSQSQVYNTESEKSLDSIVEAPSSPASVSSKEQTQVIAPGLVSHPSSNSKTCHLQDQPGGSENREGIAPTQEFELGKSFETGKDLQTDRGKLETRTEDKEREKGPPIHSKIEEVPKVSTFINRSFDTDTEESEVFPQNYQTRQLHNESSDEFDF